MPALDMSIDELEKYMGINPKPEDFDTYWETALAEMKEVDPQVILKEAEFQAPTVECYDMYFTGVNGSRIHVKHMRPRNIKGKIPAVLQFHGYSVHGGDWFPKLAYAASGVAVFAMDVRGQGGQSEDLGVVTGNTLHGHVVRGLECENSHKLFFRNVFLDTVQLAGIVMDMEYIDENRVYASGGSQGGALTIACAALEPRIAKAAPMYPFLCDHKRVWEMDLLYAEMKEYWRLYDPRHEKEEETFKKLGYIDVQYLAPRIKADVLMFTALMDNVCPPSTQYAAYNKMNCNKKHILYPDYGHEYLPDADDIVFDFFINDKF